MIWKRRNCKQYGFFRSTENVFCAPEENTEIYWDRVRHMERLEQFEKMLADILEQSERENRKMEELKAAGKEKTATYKQYFSNRLFLKMMIDRYRKYGLIE